MLFFTSTVFAISFPANPVQFGKSVVALVLPFAALAVAVA